MVSVESRRYRVGRNEALFRQVNERLRGLSQGFSVVLDKGEFVCECGDLTCNERISMTLEEYESLRSDPTLFAVIRGHEVQDVERIVTERGDHVIVRKHDGEPARLASDLDPRA